MKNISALFAIPLAALAASVQAQERAGSAEGAIKLELNALQSSDNGCRIDFVVQNALGTDITRAAYEIALFDKQGLVDRLMVLDFQDLPSNKTKVRRFNLKDTDCGTIGRILVNDASACKGDGIDPRICIAGLDLQSRSGDIAFGK